MLESIIEARLKLQSTQKELERLNIQIHSVNDLKTVKFLDKFNLLSKENQKSVLQIIGGKVNTKKTENYINEKVIHVHGK